MSESYWWREIPPGTKQRELRELIWGIAKTFELATPGGAYKWGDDKNDRRLNNIMREQSTSKVFTLSNITNLLGDMDKYFNYINIRSVRTEKDVYRNLTEVFLKSPFYIEIPKHIDKEAFSKCSMKPKICIAKNAVPGETCGNCFGRWFKAEFHNLDSEYINYFIKDRVLPFYSTKEEEELVEHIEHV